MHRACPLFDVLGLMSNAVELAWMMTGRLDTNIVLGVC